MLKKKINVIKPTLRHKKRYIALDFIVDRKIELDKRGLFYVLSKNLETTYGLFVTLETNIYIVDFIVNKNYAIIRVNKKYVNEFLTSLLFLNKRLGLIRVKSISSTIKKIENI